MSNPQQETKIELVTEAIEALVLASIVATAAHPGAQRQMFYDNVVTARAGVHDALKELLQPTLRVVCTERESVAGDLATTLRRTVTEAANLG